MSRELTHAADIAVHVSMDGAGLYCSKNVTGPSGTITRKALGSSIRTLCRLHPEESVYVLTERQLKALLQASSRYVNP